jgi:hypothetical protein
MLHPNEIDNLLNLLSTRLKSAAGAVKRKTDNALDDEPYRRVVWGPLYTRAKQHSEEIEVHAAGQFPAALLSHTFPNETEEEKHYRKKTFQPITTPYWKKAVRSLNRVWSEQNFGIKWGTDEEVRSYFTQQLPLHQNIFSYFKQVVTTGKINDPNAVLTVDFTLPVKELSEGEWLVDDSTPVQPYPVIYNCTEVLLFEPGQMALLMSSEKSMVDFGGKKTTGRLCALLIR